jgi:hypothetical protein
LRGLFQSNLVFIRHERGGNHYIAELGHDKNFFPIQATLERRPLLKEAAAAEAVEFQKFIDLSSQKLCWSRICLTISKTSPRNWVPLFKRKPRLLLIN